MRIAIIGGGIAGLGAAWCLHPIHDVVVYEQEPQCGGSAYTARVPVESNDGRIDMGFLTYHEWLYPNLTALFEILGVRTEPTPLQTLSVNFPGGSWRTRTRTPFWETIEEEANRFQLALPDIVADPLRFAELSIADYLAREKYSDDFIHRQNQFSIFKDTHPWTLGQYLQELLPP